MRHLDIAEVAQQSGVPASTLRFYDEKGLIASTGRRGLRRLFDPGVVERLAAKADELDRTIRKLSAMRDGLRHAAACPAPSHMECPTFRRIVRAAGAGGVGVGRKRVPKAPGD